MDYLKVFQFYLQYRRSQWWSADRTKTWQDRKLRVLVQHAGRYVPWYRRQFREMGFDPASFRGREDLPKLPLLDKQTVRRNKQALIADNAAEYGMHHVSTSGTTGTPLHLVLDDATNSHFVASLLRCFHSAGYRFGMRALSLQSYYLKNGPLEFKRLYNVLRYDSCHLSPGTAKQAVKAINRLKPRFFMGFPFDFVMLTRFAADAGLTIHPPDVLVTNGETLSDGKREILENELQCRVVDFYSHHESAVMACQCEHGTYHLMDDFACHEIIDVKDGQGELVGTTLYNYAMPLIRYRTGDQVTLRESPGACACGRELPAVNRIYGKRTDYLTTPDGRVFSTVMSHAMDHAHGVVMSQCIQDAPDHIRVLAVTDNTFTVESEKALLAGLRKRLGNQIRITVEKVEQLEKNRGGKTPFIISRIGNTGL